MNKFVVSLVLVLWAVCGFAGTSRAAPPAPPQLAYTTAGLELAVTWTTVPNAAGYTLYYAPAPFAGPESIGSMDMGPSTSFNITLREGAAYFIAMSAYNDDGESGYSNIEQFTINTHTPPAAPQLSYSVSGTSIVIDWDAVPGASGYRLGYMTKAYTHPGDFSVAELGGATGFSYDQLQAGGTYTIALQAYNAWGVSGYSTIETFTVLAAGDIDNDGDGYSENQGDCDDSDPLLRPWPVSIGTGGHLLTGVPGQILAVPVLVQAPAGTAYSYELLTGPPGMAVDFAGTLSYTVPAEAAQGDSAPFLVRGAPLAGGCDSTLAGTLHVVGTVANETSRTVGSSGDVVSDSRGLVSVTVPPGLLAQDAELRIAPLTGLPAGVFSGLDPLALYSVALGTDNTFAAPLTLAFAYDQGWYDAALNNGGLIVAGWNDQLGWFTPPQRIDAARRVLEVDSEHLSRWGLFRLSGFAVEPSPQGSFAVYYQPGAAPPRLPEFPLGYTMQELAEDVGGWADVILENYQSAGFRMPKLPRYIVLTDRVAETEWDPKSGYVYLKIPAPGSLEELKHDLAHEIFHTVQNSYYNFLSMSNTLWWSEATPDYAASRIGFPTSSLHAHLGIDYFETPLATAVAPGETDANHAYAFAHFWNDLVTRHGGNFKSAWDYVYDNSSLPSDASRFSAFKAYAESCSGGSFSSLWSDFVDLSLLKNTGTPGWGHLLADGQYRRALTESEPLAVLLYPLQGGYAAKPYVLDVEMPKGQDLAEVTLTATIAAYDQRIEVWKSVSRGEPVFIEMLTFADPDATVEVATDEQLVLVGKNMTESWTNLVVGAEMKVPGNYPLTGTFGSEALTVSYAFTGADRVTEILEGSSGLVMSRGVRGTTQGTVCLQATVQINSPAGGWRYDILPGNDTRINVYFTDSSTENQAVESFGYCVPVKNGQAYFAVMVDLYLPGAIMKRWLVGYFDLAAP